MTDLPEFVLDREFAAPPALVWRVWTEPDLLTRWYGPNVETIVHQFDLRPGGKWLGEMRWGDKSMFSSVEFRQVEPTKLLVWLHSSTDENWNITANPMMPDWPKTLLTTVTFSSSSKGTNLRLVWTPHAASAAEIACFSEAVANMGKGWESGFALLDEILLELQA